MIGNLRLAVSVVVAMALGAPAAAQDWGMRRGEQNVVMAYVAFDSGLSIAFRCQNRELTGMLAGLPQVDPPTERALRRTIDLSWGPEQPIYAGGWWVTTDTRVAVSDSPAMLARAMRTGGDLTISLPEGAPNGAELRYVISVPPSEQAINTVISECGRPLVDPLDDLAARTAGGLPSSISWARQPTPSYPDGATFTGGLARIRCRVIADGSLRDCTAESEFPFGGGFGEAAVRSTRRARLKNSEGPSTPVEERVVTFMVNFSLVDEVGAGGARIPGEVQTGSRIPNQ